MKPVLPIFLCVLAHALGAQQQRVDFGFETVAEMAAEAIQDTKPPEAPELPKDLAALDYDDYRSIRFRPSKALWWNHPVPFRVEFFHLGHIFTEPVDIYELSDTHRQLIPFLPDSFDYEQSGYKPGFFDSPDGYAGIRVKYPVNEKEVDDDLIVFQGASYFRALGQGQVYGLSLRGLLMNTLGAHEDFPRFTKLWLKKPRKGEKQLRIYALLQGEKVTGAYAFTVRPNGVTAIDVRCRLFFREGGAAEVGIAPITSMFVFGENSNHAPSDWRPEVHDSDGVLLHADSEWTWHALENLPGRAVKKFPVGKVRGFGLLQRDRDFANYKDLESHYEKRPSAWIEPKGRWPTGTVTLYSFGTDTEAADNVNLFWQPDLDPSSAGPLELAYTITLRLKDPEHELAKVLETRVGQRTLDTGANTVVIEFSRPDRIGKDAIPRLGFGFEAGGLEILEEPVIQYNPVQDRIRVFVHLRTPEDPSENYSMSGQLLDEGHKVSEKWSYLWRP